MNDIIQIITGGSKEFTPDVIVGLIVFCIIFDGFMMLVGNFVKGGKR